MGKVKALKKLPALLSKGELHTQYVRYQNYMGSLSKNAQRGMLPKESYLKEKFPTDYRHHYVPFDAEKFKYALLDNRKYPPHPDMIDADYDDYIELMKAAFPYKKPMTKNQLLDDMWGAKYRAQEAVIQEAVLNARIAKQKKQATNVRKFYGDPEPVKRKTSATALNLSSGMGILKGKGFFPKAKYDEATERVLHEQLRSLYFQQKYLGGENFLTRLRKKDPAIMDNLQTAVDRYTKDVGLLVGEKHRIMDPTKPLGKKLRQVAAKFYGTDDPNVIKSKLIDFSHIFPLDETVKALEVVARREITKTGKMIKEYPKGEFLDLAGSAETMYLSPSYVNQHIQRSLEGRLRDLIAIPRLKDEGYYPRQLKGHTLRIGGEHIYDLGKADKEIKRLSGLLEKVKALSYLTTKTGEVQKFGYQAKETFGKYGAPRFSDDELEELFTYMLEAKPMTAAQKLSKGWPQGLAKSQSKWMGAPGHEVLFNEGGLVNGYQKGGYIKKLLDETIGMMSRRKFMKGMGATAASAVIPKGVMALAPAAIKKGAVTFAPPWVNGMLASLKAAKKLDPFSARRATIGPDFELTGGTIVGNNAKIINMGSKKIKLYKDQTATETYFKVKTSDQVKTEEMIEGALPGIKKQDQFWDDIVLTEEKGQTSITWKNKAYDGNDQHIVIDKVNQETRFVDDHWQMEAGGGDIAKDDWIEWAITPNKSEIAVALKKPRNTIDDLTVDGYSVRDMDNQYSGMFESFVDSFSPSGNVFGTVQRMSKAIKKKALLRREKKWNDEQVRALKEKEEMDWEGQFRGGQGIHGYAKGGSIDGYHEGGLFSKVKEFFTGPGYAELPAQANNWLSIQGVDKWDGLSKKQLHDKLLTFDTPGLGIRASVVSLASRAARKNKSSSLSLNQIFFEDDPWAEDQEAYAGYLKDLGLSTDKTYDMSNRDEVFSLINTMAVMEMGREDYNSIDMYERNKVFQEGINMAYQRLVSPEYKYNSVYKNKFAEGGIARRPNAVPPISGPDPYATFIEDSIGQMKTNPSEFMGSQFIQKFNKGGFVKRVAPAVIGKLTNYKPKLTMSDVLKNIKKAKKTPPANPYAAFNKEGLVLKEFKTKAAGDKWTKEVHKKIVDEGDTTTDWIYEVKKKPIDRLVQKAEAPGALFWGSREKIIGAPSEAMTGTQWLQYMKIGQHGILNPKGYPRIKDMELNDTSLAPWLSRQGNKTISKPALVKQFDAMAPKMEVTVLGESTGGRIFDDMRRTLEKVDTQAIRNPAIKGFYDYIKAVLPQLRSSQTSKEAKEIAAHINAMVEKNFGVVNALEEGVPQRFPFEIKELLQQISTGLGKRTAGFKTYKRDPQHRGTQTMAGGDNYREFLFKYKPGSLRQTEPQYKYTHDFNLETSERMGGVVHARTSDRGDQFGRRLLHIEEIQSDMHQKINMAFRKLKKKHTDWAKEGKTPEGEYAKMTTSGKNDYKKLVASGKYAPRGDLKEEIATANEQHLLLVKSKIDDLLMQKQTPAIRTRITRLNKERAKIRKMIEEEKAKMAKGDHSGVPQGPLSKTEDYNEFIMKYLLRVAREGGYDGITINTPAIKNLGMTPTGRDYKGNLIAYGPMAQGAMKKAANKSGAKFMKTVIVDENNRAWEVPMILIKENKAAQALIDKGLPIYKKGGIVKK